MAVDQVHGPGRSSRLLCQVSTPVGVMRGHNEWAAVPARCPLAPMSGSSLEKAFAQHDDHAVEQGKRI